MAATIRKVEYFYAGVQDTPGEGHRFLAALASEGVNLLAFTAVPVGPGNTQFALFVDNPRKLKAAAERAGLTLSGPQHAILVQGDDELGALATIHRKLADASVNVFASTGVTDGRGGFGYIVHVRPEHVDEAAKALDL